MSSDKEILALEDKRYAAMCGGDFDALEAMLGILCAVCHDDHARVLRKTDTDTTAIVDRHPRRARSSVDESIEQWPICDCVAAVEHAFGFAIR